MATYAIGDIQGCYRALRRLLELIRFNSDRDQLWFVGDLVNRGPENLATLRFIKALESNAITVLGNHDLHLLAIAHGARAVHPEKDTFQDVVDAPDFHALTDWLRQRPLLHHDPSNGFTLVHAGLAPQWNLIKAQQCANEVEKTLRSAHIDDFLANMYGNEPDIWSDNLTGYDRLRVIINSFTRIRYCDATGHQDYRHNREPGSQPAQLRPWFELPTRKNRDLDIVFGHWAALGYTRQAGIYALDSGCVWGGKLTAMNLEIPEKIWQVNCGQ